MMFLNKLTIASILLLQATITTDAAPLRGSRDIDGLQQGIDETDDVFLVSFNPESDEHAWTTVNDPVMGGASTSTYTIQPESGLWEGEVKVVSFLGAPGFCTLRTGALYSQTKDIFPDATGTEYLVLQLEEDSGIDVAGLPVETFSMQIGVSDVTNPEATYQAHLSDEYCCENICQVPWSIFELSMRGMPVKGPPLSGLLDKINQIGVGTSGTAGKFSFSINSFFATNSELSCGDDEFEEW